MKKGNNETLKILIVYILFLLALIFLSACDMRVKPDIVKDGKEYIVTSNCVKYHWESDYGYHYGYNLMSGKYEWHYGMDDKQVCDSSVLDTIEVNKDKKYYANDREYK
jgi:hypothetical protein